MIEETVSFRDYVFFILKEWVQVIFRYWAHSFRFFLADNLLYSIYFFTNPYRICRKALQKRGEKEVNRYGETPLTTLEKIASLAKINKDDVVYELGCGRGRAAFWLYLMLGCKVKGFDIVPGFIKRATLIKKLLCLHDLSFDCREIEKVDFKHATAAFFYGTGFDEAVIKTLIQALSKAPRAFRIITISYPLNDFSKGKFEVISKSRLPFPWGEAEVFVQKLR